MCAGVVLTGCSNGDDHAGYFNGGAGGENGTISGPCREDAQRECGYKVGEGADNVICYRGVQSCVNGMWSECGEGMTVTLPQPDDQSFFQRASDYDVQGTAHTGGTGSTCTPSDICDPYCYELGETTPSFTAAYSLTNSVLCPTTTSLTECAATAGCEHSPCATGAGLTAALCGACVTSVCAISGFSTCCGSSGSWTSTCRDKAFEVCIKQQPPMNMCDFGVFSESTINSSNSPTYSPGSKIGAMHDIIIQASASTSTVPSQIVTPNDVLFQNLNGPATNTLSGNWWIGGALYAAAGNRTMTGYDIHVGKGYYEAGGISLTSGSIYSSAAYSLSTCTPYTNPGCIQTAPGTTSSTYFIDGQNSGTATASYTPSGATNVGTWPSVTTKNTLTPLPAPFSVTDATAAATMPNSGNVPARTTCTAGTGSVTPAAGTTTLAPGNYGDYLFNNASSTLVLDGAGDYFFRSLKFGSGCSNCKLQLGNDAADYSSTPRASTGNVGYNVAVCNGSFDLIGNAAKVYKNDGTTVLPVGDAEWLTVYVHSADPASGSCNANSGVDTCAVNIGNNATFGGLLLIPNGTFAAGNTATLNGAVWATKVITDTGFTLNQISKADCDSMISAGMCNATTPTNPTCDDATVTTGGTCPSGIVGTPATPLAGIQSSNWNGITTSMANTKCRSGADCQTNLRCNNVATVATGCTWDKCGSTPATGGNITACATDPCVARIAAAYPGTCATPGTWSATCAGYVPAVCDAYCSSPTGTTTGNCVNNATLTSEAGCTGTNGFDLSVEYVCTQNTYSICNHGATAYSSATHGALTISWWLLSNRTFAPATSPTGATGSFTTSAALNIAANSCTSITVTTPTSGALMTSPSANDYTVMVDPAWARPECGVASGGNSGRRLDNWSWYNHSYTCATFPNIAEYDYIADCSAVPDTYPRWKLLRWGAAPGASQTVRFYAKTATTSPACTGTTGGSACTQIVTNTQTAVTFPAGGGTPPTVSAAAPCALSASASNCGVNLTTALGLSTSRPQAKNLTIRAEWPAGVTTPTWDVTYSCEYDQ